MDYDTLLTAAKADPDGADFHTLRMAYTRSEHYTPYDMHSDAVIALRDALVANDFEAALAATADLLAFNYLDIEAHMAADYVHVQLEHHAESAFHRAFARGLIEAILTTGTGRDFTHAWIVISTAEEYVILRVLGFAPGGQRLVRHEGHAFDILTGKRPDTGTAVDLYFNIDLPFNWLGRNMPGDDAPGR